MATVVVRLARCKGKAGLTTICEARVRATWMRRQVSWVRARLAARLGLGRGRVGDDGGGIVRRH